MEANQDIIFTGGLNSDDSLEFIPQGDYIYLENARNYDLNSDNKLGKLTKIKGTSKIVNNKRLQFIESGDVVYSAVLSYSKTLGTVKDAANNKLYYYVQEIYSYNSGIDSRTYYVIYEYDNTTRVISNVVVRTQLEIFDASKKVKWGNVLNGFLSWVQDTIEPKGIWIEKAINYTKNFDNNTNLTPAYLSMTMQEFNIIRRPPVDIISAGYGSDDSVITNNIKGKLFQFRHKYVYNDNSESVWGMASSVALPYGEIDSNGNDNNGVNYNYLALSCYKQNTEIKEIWIASRYIDKDGILTDFAICKKIDVSGNSVGDIITYNFYNDILGTPLSDNDNAKLLDVVPLLASTQDVISNPDRIAYGNIKEPMWDNIVTDVDVSVVTEDITQVSSDLTSTTTAVYTSKTELAAYKIDSTFYRPRVHLNGNGICTMIVFNDDWITAGAENIRLSFKIRVNGVLYVYTTNQINISGLNPTQIKAAIVDKIQDDYVAAGGTVDVAFTDYSTDFVNAVNGGYANVSTSKWAGVEDFMLFGQAPTGDYIVIRTGLLFYKICEVSFPTLSAKIFNLILTNDDKKYVGWKVGTMYLSNNDILYDVSSAALVTVIQYGETLLQVGDFIGYQTVSYLGVSIPIVNTQNQLDTTGLYSRPTLAPFGKYGSVIIYYDENLRPCFAQKITETYIERENTDYAEALIYKLRFQISHLAPSWAKHWTIALTKNLSQERLTEVDLSIDIGTPITSDSSYIYIDVNTSIDLWYTTYNNTTNVYQPYIFTTGDRVIIYDSNANEYIDREIVSVDTDGKIMIQKGTLVAGNIADIVRFYSPQIRYTEDVYYEVGQLYGFGEKLADNGKYHASSGSIQTSTTPLDITLNFGDIYLCSINQCALNTGLGTTTNPTYNEFFMPFYQSKMNSYGRPHVANAKVNTEFKKARIRISNALNQESNTFGITTFDSSDYTDLPEKHGKIQALIELGYTLKAVTETKCISIYINRTVTVDPNGQEGVLLSQTTLGTVAIPVESFGTLYPNSIVKTNRSFYFLDVNNGCSVRDSANGQANISEYKYASFFKRLCDNLKESSDTVDFFSAFNKNEYYLLLNILSSKFVGIPDDKANVIVFNEALNRWTHHLRLQDSRNRYPEWADNIGNTFVTFISGELFLHDDTETYNSFYGNNQESVVEFVFNQNPKQIKLLTAIAIHGNNLWDAREDGDIYIEPNTTYASGMSSRLKPAKFRKKEGLFYSEFLRNGLTPNMTYDNAIINGHKLRGNIAKIRLRNRDKEKSDLFSVSIKYVNSELSY